jgi:hypothetical protein
VVCEFVFFVIQLRLTEGTSLTPGIYTVNVIGVDAAGLTGSCSFAITVSTDYTAPKFLCPSKIVTTLDAGQSKKAITWTEPTVDDVSSFTLSVTPKESGDLFSFGLPL